jgi:hypothetical protein
MSMQETRSDLEGRMQKVSLAISLLSLGLMVAGFLDMLVGGAMLSLPGISAVPPVALGGGGIPASLEVMSVGILLLALLPIIRVLLAAWLYVRHREILNMVVALVVLVELLLSMRSGG